MSWGNTVGAPIIAWDGALAMTFDPSASARSSTIAAGPEWGYAYRPLYAPQVQAVRATTLSSNKVETTSCSANAVDGSLYDYNATRSSTVSSIADPRIAFEVTSPALDVIAGTGTIHLAPYFQTNDGASSWYLRDRFVLPGRYRAGETQPCPFYDNGQPAVAGRIIAPYGGGAVPYAVSRWMGSEPVPGWKVKRTSSGWRILINTSERVLFSESPFGPQAREQLDIHASSELYLAGTLPQLGARCRVPARQIGKAASARAAVRLARRAGMSSARYRGVRSVRAGSPGGYAVEGRDIDSMGYARCQMGTYKVFLNKVRG